MVRRLMINYDTLEDFVIMSLRSLEASCNSQTVMIEFEYDRWDRQMTDLFNGMVPARVRRMFNESKRQSTMSLRR